MADGSIKPCELLIGVNAVTAYTAEAYLPDKFRHLITPSHPTILTPVSKAILWNSPNQFYHFREKQVNMKPVDCHCHLDYGKFDDDRDEVISRCSGKLHRVVNAGLGPESNRSTLELARENEVVEPALGLHPTNVESFEDIEEVVDQVREHQPGIIGEIGLDHHHVTDEETRETQEEVFRRLLELAEELGKPVAVHTRSAEKRCVEIIDEYDIRAHLHSFNGNTDLAERAAERGNIIGVSTQVLYSTRVQNTVRQLSLDQIVLETDSPFLYQGKRNEPVNVTESAEKIAELKDVSTREVIEATTGNAVEFYGLPEPEH